MKLQVDFSEIIKMVSKKYGKQLIFRHVDEKVATLGTVMDLGLFSKEIAIDMRVERLVDGKDLVLSCVNKSVGGVLGVLLPVFKGFLSGDSGNVVEDDGNGNIIVHLKEIKSLNKFLDKATLQDLSFVKEGPVVTFAMK